MAARKSVVGEAARATVGTDAVEVKVTVVERQEKAVLKRFGLERREAERRRIYFFDTPQVASGARPIEKLFTGDQEAFLAALSPVAIDFGKLVALGPVASLRWNFEDDGLPYEICAEEWRLPNGHDLLELSIKATREAAAAARAAFEGFLRELGFEVDASQQTKTRAALEYLAHGA